VLDVSEHVASHRREKSLTIRHDHPLGTGLPAGEEEVSRERRGHGGVEAKQAGESVRVPLVKQGFGNDDAMAR
jgi:hypothetical protein